MTAVDDLLAQAEPWTKQCGPCDAGLPMGCSCPDGDPRVVVSALVNHLEQQRTAVRRWVKDTAYSPHDIVLGPHSDLDREGYESLHQLLDAVDPGWRGAFT